MTLKLVSIIKANNGRHKYVATFNKNGNELNVKFGSLPYSDYTISQNKIRRDLYRSRHQHDRLNDPTTAGALSYYLLWGDSTDLNTNIKQFVKIFHL